MYVCLYIKLGKVRTLLESADELLSNMFDGWTGLDGVDTSLTVMTTRTPALLKIEMSEQ